MTAHILYTDDDKNIDWHDVKAAFSAAGLGDGRSPEQLSQSFNRSQGRCFARVNGMLIGTARSISDHDHRAYIADVWTHPTFRRRGVATEMIGTLLKCLHNHHIYLFTNPLWMGMYEKLGFKPVDRQPHWIGEKWLVERPTEQV